MEDRIKLQGLIEEYKELETNGARFDKAQEIRDLVFEIKRKKAEFYTHEYLEAVKRGRVTEIKRMGILLRQATKEYEKVAVTCRYDFKVDDYE